MDPNRTIRAPSTITRPTKLNAYTGSLAQNRFRILVPSGAQAQPQPQTSTLQPTSLPRPKSATTTTVTTITTTTRLPTVAKPSTGLVRPSSVRQISAAPTTSSSTLKQLSQRIVAPSVLSSTQQLSQIANRQSESNITPLSRQRVINSATVRKSTPTRIQPSPSQPIQPHIQTNVGIDIASKPSSIDVATLNTITGDVGEIRKLLEQLLDLLKSSQDSHGNLERENEVLRQEVADLRERLRAIKSTVQNNNNRETLLPEEIQHRTRDKRQAGSGLYFTPMI